MMSVDVILVDESDNELGLMEKMEAHRSGLLHRAFSVFVFNENEELLIHKRALDKYHSAGLWTNTCCSHPMPGEELLQAANRRLMEEMGMRCMLKKSFDFIYRVDIDQEMIEHEFDHVFLGYSNDNPVVDPSEVSDWKWISESELMMAIQSEPDTFTSWFKIAWPMVLEKKSIITSIKR